MAREIKLEDWCNHIVIIKYSFDNERYEIYGKYVPFSWKYCPECGQPKP